jgi:hypothetical protein
MWKEDLCFWGTPLMPSFLSSGRASTADFEDCSCLVELLDQHGADWPRVFAEFEKERKVNTDAIADMAIENLYGDAGSGRGRAVSVSKESGIGAGSKISATFRAEVCDGDVSSHSLTPWP